MTMFAETPPPLRRLFDRLDFAPHPKHEAMTHLLEAWEAQRRHAAAPWPTSGQISDLDAARSQAFVVRSRAPEHDYIVTSGAETLEPLLGPTEPGSRLSEAPRRRAVVRLRRLFDAVREAGEPVLAEFRLPHHDQERFFAEILAAPLSEHGTAVDGILGTISLRPIAPQAQSRTSAVSGHEPTGPVLFALGSSQGIGERIARHMRVPLAEHEERDFEDGEHKTRPLVNVRNRDVYVVQSLYGDAEQSPNDKLCRLLFFIGALKDAAAAQVTAVVPYLCYARKDRQTKTRDPVTTRYVAQLFEAVGTDRLITMEVHNPAAFQNAFRCDTEHLDAQELFAKHFRGVIGDEPVAVVSPDVGGVKRAEAFRERLAGVLGRPVAKAFLDKQRSSGRVSGDIFAGEVAGRVAIVIDDLISTGTSMARAAAACREHGATRVHLAATHGLFVDGSPALWREPAVYSVTIADTVKPARLEPSVAATRMHVLGTAELLGEAIRRCHEGGSISALLGADERSGAERASVMPRVAASAARL
jgi:ribose-phosphate pyrophosphokinase